MLDFNLNHISRSLPHRLSWGRRNLWSLIYQWLNVFIHWKSSGNKLNHSQTTYTWEWFAQGYWSISSWGNWRQTYSGICKKHTHSHPEVLSNNRFILIQILISKTRQNWSLVKKKKKGRRKPQNKCPYLCLTREEHKGKQTQTPQPNNTTSFAHNQWDCLCFLLLLLPTTLLPT